MGNEIRATVLNDKGEEYYEDWTSLPVGQRDKIGLGISYRGQVRRLTREREEEGGIILMNLNKMMSKCRFLSFSRLQSTIDISNLPPEDGFIMIEASHNKEPSTTLPTSTYGIEPVSPKLSDTQIKDPTLPSGSCSPDEKGTIFLLPSLKPSDTQTKVTTLSTVCNAATLYTSTISPDGKCTKK